MACMLPMKPRMANAAVRPVHSEMGRQRARQLSGPCARRSACCQRRSIDISDLFQPQWFMCLQAAAAAHTSGSDSEGEEMEIVGDMGQDFWQKGAGESLDPLA